jgi:lysophospholipase L1-like esterase
MVLFGACGQGTTPTAAATLTPRPAATDAANPAPTTPPASPTGTPPLRVVILGDSIATGGEESDSTSYGVPYASGLEALTGREVELVNRADPSETSASLLDRLRNRTTIREDIAGADIVAITVGGNDGDPFATYPKGTCAKGGTAADCLATYAPDLEADLDAILTEIETLRAGQPILIRLTSPDYNAFIGLQPSSDLPPFAADFGLAFYRQVADAETAVACAVAVKHGAACVDFLHVFNGPDGTRDAGPLLAEDHLHPSLAGRDRIAELLLAIGLEPG